MAWPKLDGELRCNTYVGVISLTNTTSPFDVSERGDQDTLCPPTANVQGSKMLQCQFESLFLKVLALILVKQVAIHYWRPI